MGLPLTQRGAKPDVFRRKGVIRKREGVILWERAQRRDATMMEATSASEQQQEGDEPTAEPFLSINDTPVYFQEKWEQGIGGGLWSTGLAMARYLEQHPTHGLHSLDKLSNDSDKKLSLLELGSGNGFLAICFLALVRDRWNDMVITDVGESHLELIQHTLDANPHLTQGDGVNVTVIEHKWGEFDESKVESENKTIQERVKNGSYKFDIIIGSDVAYRDHLHDPLIASLKRFCHENTVALIGVTMNDTRPIFFRKLREAGFRYERLADQLMEPEYRGTTFGIFVIQRDNIR